MSVVCVILCTMTVFAQKKVQVLQPKYPELFKSIPTLDSTSPEWARLLYSTTPNVQEIETAYEMYYQKHVLEKNVHTQNYKHFMRIIYENNYILDDGSVYIPSVFEEKERKKKIIPRQKDSKLRKSEKKNRSKADWKQIGPFETYKVAGSKKQSRQANVYTLEQSLSNPKVLLAGTETGALYFSVDKAESWVVIGDELAFGSRGIGAVAIDPNDDKVFYVANNNSLYKSIDQGKIWSEIHSSPNLSITDISVNPDNNMDIVTVGKQGVYRSIDGGGAWGLVLSGGRCWDVERKTDDSATLFVARTNPITNSIEIWKSINNGGSFEVKTKGWYYPTDGRAISDGGARIGVTDADSDRLYVLVLGSDDSYLEDVNFQGIYRSDDAGESWMLPYDGDGDGQPDNDPGGPYNRKDDWCMSCVKVAGGGYDQGFYNASIAVSDTDPDAFLVGMLNLFKSKDGAKTFTKWGGYQCDGCSGYYQHPDIQEIEINGEDVWVASDGGLDKYDTDFNYIASKTTGIDAAEYWGFGQGWNEDIIVGGRYHNGNTAYRPSYTNGKFLVLGGGEAPTGYVNRMSNVASFSDLEDKVIPENFTDPVTNAIVNASIYPNQEVYNLAKRSEITNDPRYANTQYLGKNNKLWKTYDGGVSYSLVHEFGSNATHKVTDIKIPRANPNMIYVVQYLPDDATKLWRSIDQGNTWSEIKGPSRHSYVELQVATDAQNELYVSYGNNYDSPNKVFKSLDGGTTWQNLTTKTLDNAVRHLIVQDGTDGGVYAVTYTSIYYRNSKMTDWEAFDYGLPTRKAFNKLIPFYKDGKMRAATYNRGIVESRLYEESAPIAQPITLAQKHYCSRDNILFDDFSVLKHKGASWQWSFPGASYVSDTTIRNPEVRYDVPGSYDVTLRVTDADGRSDTKTIKGMIIFEEDMCAKVVSDVGKALYTTSKNSLSKEYLYGTDFGLDTLTHFTMTAWIKPDEVKQMGGAGIFSAKDATNGGSIALNIRKSNELQIHYKGVKKQWSSGLFVEPGKWNYVAMVTTPTEVTLYLNGKKTVKRHTNTKPFDMDQYYVGSHLGLWYRVYRGFIDELKIWNRALSQDEIRLKRHLIQTDMSDPNLQAYWQFNELVGGVKVYDKKANRDLIVKRTPELLTSTAPVGNGSVYKLNVTQPGRKDFVDADVVIDFGNGVLPNGEVVVSKLHTFSDPNTRNFALNSTYWVINNYGTNTDFAPLKSIRFKGVGVLTGIVNTSELRLFKCNDDDIATERGVSEVAFATTLDKSLQTVTYANPQITSFGPFYNGHENSLDVAPVQIKKSKSVVYPNPLTNGATLWLGGILENVLFTLFDIQGKELLKTTTLNNQVRIDVPEKGIYLYQIEKETKIITGKLVIQ